MSTKSRSATTPKDPTRRRLQRDFALTRRLLEHGDVDDAVTYLYGMESVHCAPQLQRQRWLVELARLRGWRVIDGGACGEERRDA